MARKVNCYIGLGSNLGERSTYIKRAIRLIWECVGPVSAKSFVYESEPWGTYEGETFKYLNAVVLVATRMPADAVLAELQAIENAFGRKRSTANAPRTIDLDILYYGQQIIESEHLVVPHPLIPQRRFVLEPLHDIDPDFTHPALGITTRQLLEDCPDPHQELTRV